MKQHKVAAGSTIIITEKLFSEMCLSGHFKAGAGSLVVIAPNSEDGFLSKLREILPKAVVKGL
jgi:hypothetical protein